MPRAAEDTVRITLRVTPRASRDKIKSVEEAEGEIAAAVAITAPPVEGEANAHLVKFLAKRLGIKKNQLTIITGETGRRKILSIAGLRKDQILARLKEKTE